MENFVSIIFDKNLVNEERDIVLDSIITTGNIGLLESEIEYEIYETTNKRNVLTFPTISKSACINSLYLPLPAFSFLKTFWIAYLLKIDGSS